MNSLKKTLLAATFLVPIGTAALAQKSPGYQINTLLDPGFTNQFEMSKVDTVNGSLTTPTINTPTINGGQAYSLQLTGSPTAPLQPLASGNNDVANTQYVDQTVANLKLQSLIACPKLTVAASQVLTYPSNSSYACYDLLLSQNNPVLTIVGGTGQPSYQRIDVQIIEPAGASYTWAWPTSSSSQVSTLTAGTPNTAAGSRTQFALTSFDGGVSTNITGGTSTSAPPTTAGPTTATTLTLDTPSWTAPNAAVTFTGSYTGNPSAAVDLSFDGGNTWVSNIVPTIISSLSRYSVLTAGVAAGTYHPQIRDHNAPTVLASAGVFLVNAWTPNTLTSSPGASAVWEFDSNNPSSLGLAADGSVAQVYNSLNATQYLVALTGSSGNTIKVARNSGNDNHRTTLQMQPTKISSNSVDPLTNWLSAGNIQHAGGYAGSALLHLADMTNVSASGVFTVVEAVNYNLTAGYTYSNNFIWGQSLNPGPLQYVQSRWNAGSGQSSVQISDASGGYTNPYITATGGWHVITMIKNIANLTHRQDGAQVAAATVTSQGSFGVGTGQTGDFFLGGGFPSTQPGGSNGVPPPFIGEFQAYQGALQGSDLVNAEVKAGNAVGLSLTPTVPAVVATASQIAVAAPSSGPINQRTLITATYQGSPQGVNYCVSGSTNCVAATVAANSLSISGGTITFYVPANSFVVGQNTVTVQDINAPTTVYGTSPSFVMTAAPTSAATLALTQPASTLVAGANATISGNYTGGPPQVLDCYVGGSISTSCAVTINNDGTYSLKIQGSAIPAGTTQVYVQDHYAASVQSNTLTLTASAPVTMATATAITVNTPPSTPAGTAIPVSGTYTSSNGNPTLLWSTDNVTYNTVAATVSGGNYSFNIPGTAIAASINKYSIYVKDANSATYGQSGSFLVPSYSSSTLSASPGASLVWAFDPNSTSQVPAASDGSVAQVYNLVNSAQYLTSVVGSSGNKIFATSASGSDSKHRVLKMNPSSVAPPTYDPGANFLSAAAGGGGTLINLIDGANAATSSATVIMAADIEKVGGAGGTTGFINFCIWGQVGSPGPLQYMQLRYNGTNVAWGFSPTDNNGANETSTSFTNGWHILTVIKHGNVMTLRIDKTQVASGTFTSVASFTSKDFMIGGIFPPSTSATPSTEGGSPPPHLGAVQIYSGNLQGVDLTNQETLVGSSEGL